jgi:hypothetical protein
VWTVRGSMMGMRVRLPSAVRRFICGFDRGHYPELIGNGRIHLRPSAPPLGPSHPGGVAAPDHPPAEAELGVLVTQA